MIDLEQIQKDLSDWQHRNFGVPDITHLALGIGEEAGETQHHVLKGLQRIRGGENGIDEEKVADGVMDTFIYGLQLLTALGVDAEEALETTLKEVLARDWRWYCASVEVEGNPHFNGGFHAQLKQGKKQRILEEAYACAMGLLEDCKEIDGVYACVLSNSGAPCTGFDVTRLRSDLFRLTRSK